MAVGMYVKMVQLKSWSKLRVFSVHRVVNSEVKILCFVYLSS